MAEKLFQLFRLTLCFVSLYGGVRFIMRSFSMRAEFALPFCLSAIGLFLVFFAVCNLLIPAIWFVFILGIVSTVFSIRRKDPVRFFYTAGIRFFLFFSALFLFLLYGSRLTHIDNYSHWGAILKLISVLGKLPDHNPLVYFPSYPPGSSLLIFWFSIISGIRAEWFYAWIQSIFLSACVTPLYCLINDSKKNGRILAIGLTFFITVGLLCGNTDPADLLVDTLIALLGLVGVLYIFQNEGNSVIPLAILAAYLPMVKNSGYFFSFVIILFILLDSEGRNKKQNSLVLLFSVFLANRIWSWHVSHAFTDGLMSYHSFSIASFKSEIMRKSGSDLIVITKSLGAAVLRSGRLSWLLLITLLLCLAYKHYRNKQVKKWMLLFGVVVWLLYIISLLGMYFFSMSGGEALSLAAFDRYYATITVFLTGWFWALALTLLRSDSIGPTIKGAAASLTCVLLLLLCSPHLDYLLPQRARTSDELTLRVAFDDLIREASIPPEQSYLVVTNPEHEILSRVMCTYLLWPQCTVTCSDPADLSEQLGRATYFIILEENDAAEELRERLQTSDRANWINIE